MSASNEEEKESQKVVPLDLARNQVSAVRTVEGKSPLIMSNQSLRSMRVLTQGVSTSNTPSVGTPTILATNLVSQTVLKTDSGRPQLASIITSTTQAQATNNLSRPTQITLSASPLVAQSNVGTSYHVPRGPAVVANLAAPRSNVTTARPPMVVTAQTNQSFVRPARTPSPAQGTTWLTNPSNGSQIKTTPTVLTSPVRGATAVAGKPQVGNRTQAQSVSTIRSGTILQNAITIGQSGQIHSFKGNATSIQNLGATVSITQVLPTRTQAVVYNTNTQFTPARITVTNAAASPRPPQPRPATQITTARLTVPVNVSSPTRIITPQATVLTSGARISAVTTPQPTVIGSAQTRIVSTQPNVTIGRLSVAASPASVTTANILGQARIPTLNLHSLVAVANNASNRNLPAQQQGAKVITQSPPGTIHLTPLSPPVKSSSNVITTSTRTISVPATVVTQQRQTTTQAISIAKVFPQSETQSATVNPTNVYIHAQVQPAPRPSPGPVTTAAITQVNSALPPTTTVATYSLSGNAYFFENSSGNNFSGNRTFAQQQTTFSSTIQTPQQQQQHIRPPMNNQVHGIVANQQMRFNPVMVVEQNRGQQQQQQQFSNEQSQENVQITKVTSSPRPSISRKRDHEGSPLKAAKNLTSVLSNMPSAQQQQQQQPASISPPPRPDSEGNGHSSGGSTTISATSSPGIAEVNEDSNPPQATVEIKEEIEQKPIVEMSPRKKPRKQQLTGNELEEHNDDMQFLSESIVKKENEDSDMNHSDEPKDGAPEAVQVPTVRKPATASLLNSYRQNWKATHNHYLRHSDVRPKDERRPTIMDLANQYRVQDKVNGWKIHHLSTQMEDLADQENGVYNQLTELLKCTESVDGCKQYDRDINRINELIKGNLQRIKIINDGMLEAKASIMKIFDHKVHVTDIINRCASKRNFKKRDKS